MVRLLSVGIECFSSLIFIIPVVVILQYGIWRQRSFRKFILVLLFAVYVMAVFSVTGIPALGRCHVDLGFNLIPLIDIVNSPADYLKNTALNILLFVPMGFLLPAVWKEYRSGKAAVLMGLAVSVTIEALQIFTFRLTDIDDLITNTAGTFLGYYLARRLAFRLPLKLPADYKDMKGKWEPIIILVVVFCIGFFLKPFVSDGIWDVVLSSAWWEKHL